MKKTNGWMYSTVSGLIMTLLAYTAVCAQGNWTQANETASSNVRQARQATQNAWLAESIVASRESAMGRSLDPVYRTSLKNTLASLPTTQLELLRYAGSEGSLGLDAVGDSSTSLLYTPVTPCRLFDTRSSTAGILVNGTERNFKVAGNTGFPDQGGNSGGCNIPFGPATAVIINFVAVAPTGAGHLRAWAVANPQPDAPFAAVINYSTDTFALANGVTVPICDPAATSCNAGDLRLRADYGSVHVVGDVVGYFRKLDLPAAMPMGSQHFDVFHPIVGNQQIMSATPGVLPHDGHCHVTCNVAMNNPAHVNPGGQSSISTVRRDVLDAQNHMASWSMYLSPTSSGDSSASKTDVWSVTGGRAYKFGCWLYTAATANNVFANVSWICR